MMIGVDGRGLLLKRNAAIVTIVPREVANIMTMYGDDALDGLFF